jgi:tetratricopeptide (TPR) repeat protein
MLEKKIYLLALVIVLLTSCSGFLNNQDPQSFLSPKTFYKTETQMKEAINGAYSALQQLYSGDGLFWIMAEERSDNTTFQFEEADRGRQANEKADFFQMHPATPVVRQLWKEMYAGISQCNSILDHIDKANLTDQEKNQISGQAEYIRALLYFDLVRLYGGVPLILHSITTPNEATKKSSKRASSDSVYTQVLNDAQNAVDKLPLTWPTNEVGKATKGAANTLLGLVYLTRKDYPDAINAFHEVIKSESYSLISNYASLYGTNNKYNSESIFEIGFNGDVTGEQSNYIYHFAPFNSGSDIIGFHNLGGHAGYNIPTRSMLRAYKKGDARKDASIAWYVKSENKRFGVALGDSIPYIKKYAVKPVEPSKQSVDFYVYRYAQVLLWYAEAMNEEYGPNDPAKYSMSAFHALNKVRNRAGLGSLKTGLSQLQFRKAVYHEERIESAFEDHRWFQLLRTGRAIEVMTKQGEEIKKHHKHLDPADYNIQSYKLLLPIPAREVELTGIKQNPGW